MSHLPRMFLWALALWMGAGFASAQTPVVSGDLIADVESQDLSASSDIWTNRSISPNSVGNFHSYNSLPLVVSQLAYNSNTVNVLFIDDSTAQAVGSAVSVPAEIIGNNPVSVEAWVWTPTLGPTAAVVEYGVLGGSGNPLEERQFSYGNPSAGAYTNGAFTGNFGNSDSDWPVGTVTSNTWHHVVWTYDEAGGPSGEGNLRGYLDGVLQWTTVCGPFNTPATVLNVGCGWSGSNPNGSKRGNPFTGYIASARVETGVLTASQIAYNYSLGPGVAAPSGVSVAADIAPLALTWYIGHAATFTASFTGSPPLTSQLQVNTNGSFVNVTGALSTSQVSPFTAALTITNLQLTNAGQYRLVVSNAYGTNSTSVASLTVLALPVAQTPVVSGDVIADVESQDLSASSAIWTNRSVSPNSVGNFHSYNSLPLVVSAFAYNTNMVKALFVNDSTSQAVGSAVSVPAEIVGNNPVSVETWVWTPAFTNSIAAVVEYGVQGGTGNPLEERAFCYGNNSPTGDYTNNGAFTGDFGNSDSSWPVGTLSVNTWHYLVWTYDEAGGPVGEGNLMGYMDGILQWTTVCGPFNTPATVLSVGCGWTGSNPSGSQRGNPFTGYIASARVETGVLTASQIAHNYAVGPGVLAPTPLNLSHANGMITLSWLSGSLQEAAASTGPWTNVPSATSPWTVTPPANVAGAQFYRLEYPQ